MRGHSRSKNGVASLAYDPRIPPREALPFPIGVAGTSPAMTHVHLARAETRAQLHLAPCMPPLIQSSALTPFGGFTHSAGKRMTSTTSGCLVCLLKR